MARTNFLSAAVLLLLAAAGAAWLRFAPERATTAPTPSALIATATLETLRGIELIEAGATRERLAPIRGVGWVRTGEGEAPWPVEEGRLQAFLTLLSRARGLDAESPGAEPARTLALESEGGTVRLGFDEGVTGGQGLVRIEGADGSERWVRTSGDLHALVGSGFAAWRRGTAAPTAPGRATTLDLSAAETTLSFARSQGSWRMVEPAVTRADEGAVNRVLSALSGAKIVGWDAPAMTEGASPIATIRLTRRPVGEEGPRSLVQVLEILGGGDASNQTLVVRSVLLAGEAAVWGPSTLLVEAEPFVAISSAPEAYLPRSAIGAPASLVVEAMLTRPADGSPADGNASVRLVRGPSGWSAGAGGAWAVDLESWARGVEAMAAPTAREVRLGTPPDAGDPLLRIDLPLRGVGESEVLMLHRSTAGSQGGVLIRSDGVWWRYPGEQLRVEGWVPGADEGA